MSKSFNAVDHTNFSQQLSNCCIVSVQYDQIAFLLGVLRSGTQRERTMSCAFHLKQQQTKKKDTESHFGSRNHKLVKGP